MPNKKVLITGATGFIGSHSTEHCVELGFDVKAFDWYNPNNNWGWLEGSKYKDYIEIILGDIRDYNSVYDTMKVCDSVFHLAALIDIAYSYVSPLAYIRTNIESTYNVLEASRQLGLENGFSVNKSTRKRISAIIPVHVFGNAVNLELLLDICRERDIKIVEDATESLDTVYTSGALADKHCGTIRTPGCLSFNGNKIIMTGGAGMILSDDAGLAEKAKYLTTQAKDDSVEYIHNEIGYNYRLTNIQAAMGCAQLEQIDDYIVTERRIADTYTEALKDVRRVLPPCARRHGRSVRFSCTLS